MKRLIYAVFCAALLVGCKSTKQTATAKFEEKRESIVTVAEEKTAAHHSDAATETVATEVVTEWSAPDSLGNQYPVKTAVKKTETKRKEQSDSAASEKRDTQAGIKSNIRAEVKEVSVEQKKSPAWFNWIVAIVSAFIIGGAIWKFRS